MVSRGHCAGCGQKKAARTWDSQRKIWDSRQRQGDNLKLLHCDSAGKKTVKGTELRCVSENKTQNSIIKIGETAS